MKKIAILLSAAALLVLLLCFQSSTRREAIPTKTPTPDKTAGDIKLFGNLETNDSSDAGVSDKTPPVYKPTRIYVGEGSVSTYEVDFKLPQLDKPWSKTPEHIAAEREGALGKITLMVVNSAGVPVGSANVNASFWNGDGNSLAIETVTNEKGLVELEAKSRYDMVFQINKEGYYGTNLRYRFSKRGYDCVRDGRWQPWNPKLEVVLKEVRNPVEMVAKSVELQIPQKNKYFGFDLSIGDIVAPEGKGRTADILIKCWGDKSSPPTLCYSNHVQFAAVSPIGGFIAKQCDAWSGFMTDYTAPATGYTNTVTYSYERTFDKVFVDTALPQTEYLATRTRVVTNYIGEAVSANYGKIMGPIRFGISTNDKDGAVVAFSYYFNPNTDDRNLENNDIQATSKVLEHVSRVVNTESPQAKTPTSSHTAETVHKPTISRRAGDCVSVVEIDHGLKKVDLLSGEKHSDAVMDARKNGALVAVTFKVVDNRGQVVPDATIRGAFWNHGKKGFSFEKLTDANGLVSLQNECVADLNFSIVKDGYYKTTLRYWFDKHGYDCVKDGRWIPWNPTIEVVLKRIVNPIPMYCKTATVFLPEKGKAFGFDCLKGDLVEPFGKGVETDFFFEYSLTYSRDNSWNSTNYLYITFPTNGGALPPSNGKNVFFVHGFKVDEEGSRAWNSEMFKRLWQSGSNARFHGVEWNGNESWQNGSLNYQDNVFNAFLAAPILSSYVNSVGGQKTILAHSLGNMVVSSAVADHGMSVGKFLMLNAAVASEAYDETQWSDSPDVSNTMVHDDWRDYTNKCWSANWHKLWPSGNDHRALTWKNRFSTVPGLCEVYNYYSSGDEVLALNSSGSPLLLSGVWESTGNYSWHKQEVFKGRWGLNGYGLSFTFVAGTGLLGWGFHGTYTDRGLRITGYTVDEANAATSVDLMTNPVFRHIPDGGIFDSILPVATQNNLLAKGIPALSGPVGGRAVGAFDTSTEDRNTNMNAEIWRNGWPRDNPDVFGFNRWLHSDIKNAAYFYNYRILMDFVAKGDLE